MLILNQTVAAETEVLLKRWETEPEHTRHVAHLSVQLFDQLQPWHGYGNRDRDLLACAAVLHDIGWSTTQPDGTAHHKASAELIRAHSWIGWSDTEIESVAEIARYHRKSLPDLIHHESFARLAEPLQRRVNYLAAFLRIADGLDRRHLQRVCRLTARFSTEGLLIVAHAPEPVELELAAASKKADLLRKFLLSGPFFSAQREG